MSDDIKVFNYEDHDIRVILDEQGEPWIVAKDLAEVLGYIWKTNLVNHVPEQWKGAKPISTLGGVQEMIVLSEQGMYFFLARSDKPAALPFQMYLAGEVMPAVRKHGGYLTPGMIEEVLLNPDTIIRLATDLRDERLARLKLETEKKLMLPAVTLANTFLDTEDKISVLTFAKMLETNLNMKEMGPYKLYAFMRFMGWLMGGSFHTKNLPYERTLNDPIMSRWFKVSQVEIRKKKDGTRRFRPVSYLTPVGIMEITPIVRNDYLYWHSEKRGKPKKILAVVQ